MEWPLKASKALISGCLERQRLNKPASNFGVLGKPNGRGDEEGGIHRIRQGVNAAMNADFAEHGPGRVEPVLDRKEAV